MNGLVIYKGKYGATRQYALWIGESLGMNVKEEKDVTRKDLGQAKSIIIGSSVYIGKLLNRNWLADNADLFNDQQLFFFVVAGTPMDQTEKLERFFDTSVPVLLQQKSKHFFLPGKMEFRKLSLKDKMLMTVGKFLATRKGEVISTDDYDSVKREHITPLLSAVLAHNVSKVPL